MPPMIVSGTHDWYLVLLSIAVAILAAFTALSLASRVRASRGRIRSLWLAAAAIALGGGIWSMHFVAMLAFSMPNMPMSYDLGLTLTSLAIPVAFTAAGFAILDWQQVSRRRIGAAGLLIGLGVVAMHYIGMAAMRMPATLTYDKRWVAASVAIALLAATTATWLASRERRLGGRVLAATVMGAAIAGMHYSGMYAAIFTSAAGMDRARGTASIDQTYLAVSISLLTVLILVLSLGAAETERALRRASRREARVALRLRIADILRGEDADRSLHEVAALLGEHFAVRRVGFGDYDPSTHAFEDCGGWADGDRIPPTDRSAVTGLVARAVAALAAGETIAIEDLAASSDASDPHVAEGVRDADTRAVLIVPFDRRGRQRTVIYLCDSSPRAWRRSEIALMEELADRIRLVMERNAAEEALRELNASLEARVESRTRALEEAQEALRHAQKMEAMGQLTGGVAHDFNNLLTPILGALDRLHHKGLPDERDARLVAAALQSADRAKTLVQRLLTVARRQPLTLVPVDVGALAVGMRQLIVSTVGPRISVDIDVPRFVPLASADPNQLEMALLNLVVNARDAMPEGGWLRIVVERKSTGDGLPAALAPREYVRLSVSDTGMGMDVETQRRAIEPFFSTKGIGHGTGLGLSMAHGLAAQLGGALTIESRLGSGTTICLWLPAGEADGATE